MSEHATKERILDAAETLMLEKSVPLSWAGLSEILKSVGVTEGPSII